ncbi:hypothetical protein N2152v2_011110 [Parachlorella kessleri]
MRKKSGVQLGHLLDSSVAQLRALLSAGADVALASLTPACSPLDILVKGLRRELGPLCETPPHYRELARVFIEAGCKVDSPVPGHPDVYVHTVSAWLSMLLGAIRLGQGRYGVWPRDLHPSALELSEIMLRAAAAEQPAGRPEFLDVALAVGSLELVQLVLDVFPGAPAWLVSREHCQPVTWEASSDHFLEGRRQRVQYTPLEMALKHFADGLVQLKVPAPECSWDAKHALPVLHFCRLAQTLLKAGCPAIPRLSIAKKPARQLLPLVVRDAKWCLETHTDFPLDFQEATKTLLLINSHRGLGQHRSQTELQLSACQSGGIYLPEPLLLYIVSMAANPLPHCVRQLVEFSL